MDSLENIIHINVDMENVNFSFTLNDTLKAGIDKEIMNFHSHRFFTLCIVIKGSVRVEKDNEVLLLSQKDLLIVPPKTIHKFTPDNDAIFFSLGIELENNEKRHNENLYSVFSDFFEKLFFTHIKNQASLAEIALELEKDLAEKDIALHYRLKIHLSRIIFNIYDTLSVITKKNALENGISPENMDKYKNANIRSFFIDSYLQDHFRENISLTSLAQKLYLSTKQLNRIIFKQYKRTFYRQLTFLRIEEAKQLLSHTQMTVEEIAYSIGYSTHTGFYKAFKQITGTIPSEFRK